MNLGRPNFFQWVQVSKGTVSVPEVRVVVPEKRKLSSVPSGKGCGGRGWVCAASTNGSKDFELGFELRRISEIGGTGLHLCGNPSPPEGK